jgi:hypothetical protein
MKKTLLTLLIGLAIILPASAQTYYSWRQREAADCTAITDGKNADLCRDTSDNTLWKCVPEGGATGTCDTVGEWTQVGGGQDTLDAVVQRGNVTSSNIGIGTTSARYTLDVVGTVYANNIGIGTSAPLSRLAVGGGVSIGTTRMSVAPPSDGLSVYGYVTIGTTEERGQVHIVPHNGFTDGVGGDKTTVVMQGGTYRLHSFTTPGTYTFTAPRPGTMVEVYMVGGGGGGGIGGGGSGGRVQILDYAVTSYQQFTVTVGQGGIGGGSNTNGGDSVFGSFTAYGGGSGGRAFGGAGGGSGGSGGGCNEGGYCGSGYAGPPRQGYNGGGSAHNGGGGGGGVTGNGYATDSSQYGGFCGQGETTMFTGTPKVIGYGGQGGGYWGDGGCNYYSVANSGNGGQGSYGGGSNGDNGVVYIRYLAPTYLYAAFVDGGVSINTTSTRALLNLTGGTNSYGGTTLAIVNSDNSPLMHIFDNGNVGVGTSTPGQRLDVAGTVRATKLLVTGNIGINNANPVYGLDVLGTVNASYFIGNGALISGLSKSQVSLAYADNTSDADKPISNATQAALDSKLSSVSPTITGNGITINGEGSASYTIENALGDSLTNRKVGDSPVNYIAQQFVLSEPTTISGVYFYVNTSSGSPTGGINARVETQNAGLPSGTLADSNLAYNVASPLAGTNTVTYTDTVLVAGTYWFVLTANAQSSKYWTIDYAASNYYAGGTMAYYSSGSWTAVATADMRFGISTKPIWKSLINIQKSGTTLYSFGINSLNDSLMLGTSSPLISTRLTVSSDGSVGIGTTSPVSLLEVSGDSKLTNLRIPGKLYGGITSSLENIQSSALVWDGNVGLGSTNPQGKLDVGGITNTTWTNVTNMVFDSGVNVGLGSSAPKVALDVQGGAYIGSGANNTHFEIDGTLVMEGDAIVFDDLQVNLQPTASLSAPSISTKYGSRLYTFSDEPVNEDSLPFVAQMPHSWKLGTTIHPHVHFVGEDTTACNYKWNVDYRWTNINVGIGTTSTTATVVIANSGTADLHNYAELTDMDGTGKGLSSIISGTLYRNSTNAADTCDGKVAYLLQFDLHYEADTLGSRGEVSK